MCKKRKQRFILEKKNVKIGIYYLYTTLGLLFKINFIH